MPPSRRSARLVVFLALAGGLLLSLPAVRGPLALDDYAQRAMIEGVQTPPRSAMNLYDFVSDSNRAALLDSGAIPWWTDARLKLRFLRPLPSLLVWLDHRLFGYEAFVPHLESALWWIAAMLAAYRLYRASLGQRPAVIALVVLALSPTHTIPLVWLANRDALLTLALGALALSLYVPWRAGGDRSLGLASTAAFGAAMLTGEYAACLAGYVLAIEIFHPHERIAVRFRRLLPFALPALAYGAVHFALGYGASRSGFYRDPFIDPVGYVRALPFAVSRLLAEGWLGLGEGAWSGTFAHAAGFAAVAVLILLVLGIGSLWRRSQDQEERRAGWLMLGSLLALVPVAATEPSPRVLGLPALGISATIALAVKLGLRALLRKEWTPRATATIALGLGLGCVHLVVAPIEAHRLAARTVDDELWYEKRLGAVTRVGRAVSTIVVVRANYPSTVLWTPLMLRDRSLRHWLVLSQTLNGSVAVRNAPSSLDLIQEDGPVFGTGDRDFFRVIPPVAGEVVDLPGVRATVLRVDDDGRPKAVRYELAQDLDAPDVAWIIEGTSGFTAVTPPPVGMGVRLAP
jgi:hypothetical protein